MGRILVWVAVGLAVWLLWWLWVASRRRSGTDGAARSPAGTSTTAADASSRDEADDSSVRRLEPMLQCAVCGVHVPGSEARFAGGRVYCSDEHRAQGVAAAERADPARPDDR
jgi:uncharacterized protein